MLTTILKFWEETEFYYYFNSCTNKHMKQRIDHSDKRHSLWELEIFRKFSSEMKQALDISDTEIQFHSKTKEALLYEIKSRFGYIKHVVKNSKDLFSFIEREQTKEFYWKLECKVTYSPGTIVIRRN